MKKYIGTKQVEAEPMTMGNAYSKGVLQAGKVPSEAEKDKAGYHVKYKDGYESWSPQNRLKLRIAKCRKKVKICASVMLLKS